MDLLVPRYRAFAVLMDELGDMEQALLAGGAANQFALDVQKIRRDCATRVTVPSTQPESSVSQATDKPATEVEDMASETNTEENPPGQSSASEPTSRRTSGQSQFWRQPASGTQNSSSRNNVGNEVSVNPVNEACLAGFPSHDDRHGGEEKERQPVTASSGYKHCRN